MQLFTQQLLTKKMTELYRNGCRQSVASKGPDVQDLQVPAHAGQGGHGQSGERSVQRVDGRHAPLVHAEEERPRAHRGAVRARRARRRRPLRRSRWHSGARLLPRLRRRRSFR